MRRKRSTAGLLRLTASVYRRHPLLFLVLAAGVALPYCAVVLVLTGDAPLADHGGLDGLLEMVVETALVTPLISALHVHAVLDISRGRAPLVGSVARRGMRALPIVAATSVLATIGIAVGLVLLVVPGVILTVRWAVAAQAAALEDLSPPEALRRSWLLTENHSWHVFALILVTTLAGAALSLSARALLGSDATVATVVVGAGVLTAIYSLTALTTALLYFELPSRVDSVPAPT